MIFLICKLIGKIGSTFTISQQTSIKHVNCIVEHVGCILDKLVKINNNCNHSCNNIEQFLEKINRN